MVVRDSISSPAQTYDQRRTPPRGLPRAKERRDGRTRAACGPPFEQLGILLAARAMPPRFAPRRPPELSSAGEPLVASAMCFERVLLAGPLRMPRSENAAPREATDPLGQASAVGCRRLSAAGQCQGFHAQPGAPAPAATRRDFRQPRQMRAQRPSDHPLRHDAAAMLRLVLRAGWQAQLAKVRAGSPPRAVTSYS